MNPKVICITGGIGSGKSLISRVLQSMQIPVYHADQRAKDIYEEQPDLKIKLQSIFGNEVLDKNGQVNRKALSEMVFADKSKLELLNDLVHPLVKQDYLIWLKKHPHEAAICREVAILFESGTDSNCDFIVTINAPEKLRIERVMKRDGADSKSVAARIANQWTDEQRSAKSHFTITNDGQSLVLPQINTMLQAFRTGLNI